jgi:predicted enzyme related to lactoylglutathione lyase
MSDGIRTLIYPVRNIEQTKSLLGIVLGTEPYVDEPYYVGFRTDGTEIGLDPNGHSRGMIGPVPYAEVADINATYDLLIKAGAEGVQEPKGVGQGKLIAYVKDADGNMIGIMHTP